MNCTRSLVPAILIMTLLGFASSSLAQPASADALTASLLSDSLTFSGVTRGGEVVVFGISVRNDRGLPTRSQFAELLSDGDGDGKVVFQPKSGIPFRSVWGGVDLSTGAVAVTAPEGYELDHADLELRQIKHDRDGLAVALEIERFSAYMLLVRPGAGAWLYMGFEGGGNDGDRSRDGRLTAVFADAEGIGARAAKAPKHLKRGDVIAVMDPSHLDLRTWTITK